MNHAETQVISPHLDDAVLSLGQYMGNSHPRVVTVFAGIPNGGLSDYDRSCGFESSTAAMWERRLEDEKACATLASDPVHLDFLDGQYRPHWNTDDIADLISDITAALAALPGVPTFAPLGIGHPDHVLVTRCALDVFGGRDGFLLYEELPYRVVNPEQVVHALDLVRALGFTVEQYLPVAGEREAKEAALRCYRSQIGDDLDPCFLVPERAWRVMK